MIKTELLPCPFCGGPVELERASDTYEALYGRRAWWGVVCRNTENVGGTCAIQQLPSASPEAAVKRWNRRASASALAKPVQPVVPAIPAEIAAIIERLHTQDNRITANPFFAVQQKRIVGGVDEDYTNTFAWVCDGSEVDSEEAASLEALHEAGEPIPDDYRRVGYIEKWEFVTGCLTEQGCKDYIACNGHNLKEPRIYAYGAYRNREYIALREWLMSLREPARAALAKAEEAMPRGMR